MSTKFFTNEEGRTLIDKIEGVFLHKRIHFLDILVGYFRASGYFRVRPFVQQSGKIRILVGINVDRLVQEAWDKGLQFGANPATSRAQFLAALSADIQASAYSQPVEAGMIGLVDDVASGKVEIRIHPSQTIHAKVYIFREETKHPHGYGAVITGSSNLTDAGLEPTIVDVDYFALENMYELNYETSPEDVVAACWVTSASGSGSNASIVSIASMRVGSASSRSVQ